MPSLEANLAAFEGKVVEAQKSADALTKALRDLKKAAVAGNLPSLEKELAAISQRALQAQLVVDALPSDWSFDWKGHLNDGYLEELRAEAEAQGIKVVVKDGRLYCFPHVLRLEAGEGVARIGRKPERRLRPKELVRHLSALQRGKQRFPTQRFLDVLYRAYQRVQGDGWKRTESGPGPAAPLAEIHEVLTLLPGSDYSIEEFGRDLLLLARQPDARTRDGCSFEFVGATMSKERVRRISVYDEQGLEVPYIAIRFVRGK